MGIRFGHIKEGGHQGERLSKMMPVRLTPSQHQGVVRAARETGLTASEFVRRSAEEALRRREAVRRIKP